MRENFVFRIQYSKNDGMRMPYDLYQSIIVTTHKHNPEKELSYLLAPNTYEERIITNDQVSGFKKDLSYAGQIILTTPLLNWYSVNNDYFLAKEKKYTPTEVAINLATLIELCSQAKKKASGISITIENESFDHLKLSLSTKLEQRKANWLYPADATKLTDYILQFK